MEDAPFDLFYGEKACEQPQCLTSACHRCPVDFGEKNHVEMDFLSVESVVSELRMPLLPHQCIDITAVDSDRDMSTNLELPLLDTQLDALNRNDNTGNQESLLKWREECEALLTSITAASIDTPGINTMQQKESITTLPVVPETNEATVNRGFQNVCQNVCTSYDIVNIETGSRINEEETTVSYLQDSATVELGSQHLTGLNPSLDLQDSEELFGHFDGGFDPGPLVGELDEGKGSFSICDIMPDNDYYPCSQLETTYIDTLDNVGDDNTSAGLCSSLSYGIHMKHDSLISGREIVPHTGTGTCNDYLDNVSNDNYIHWNGNYSSTPTVMQCRDSKSLLKDPMPTVANGIEVSALKMKNGGGNFPRRSEIINFPRRSETINSKSCMNRAFTSSLPYIADKITPFPSYVELKRRVQGYQTSQEQLCDSYAVSDKTLLKESDYQNAQSSLAPAQQDNIGLSLGDRNTLRSMEGSKREIKADQNTTSALILKPVLAKGKPIGKNKSIQKSKKEPSIYESVTSSSLTHIPHQRQEIVGTIMDQALQMDNFVKQNDFLATGDKLIYLNTDLSSPNRYTDVNSFLPVIDKTPFARHQKALKLSSTSLASDTSIKFVGALEKRLEDQVHDASKGKKSVMVRVGKNGRCVSVPADSVNRLMVRDLLSMSGNRPVKSIKEATKEYRRDRNRIVIQKQQRLKARKGISQCPSGSHL